MRLKGITKNVRRDMAIEEHFIYTPELDKPEVKPEGGIIKQLEEQIFTD